MKEHEIAKLTNDLSLALKAKMPDIVFPASLEMIISESIVESNKKQSTQARVIELINDELDRATANSNRMFELFKGKSKTELDSLFAISGKTCKEIINECREVEEELAKCLQLIDEKITLPRFPSDEFPDEE